MDIVERLRGYDENDLVYKTDMIEAADEIERLRQQNAELQSIAYIIDGHGIVHHSFIIVYNDPAIAKATGGE